jgi:hypothetical protein
MECYWKYGNEARSLTYNTSWELVNRVLLEIWEQGPFSKLGVLLVKNQ